MSCYFPSFLMKTEIFVAVTYLVSHSLLKFFIFLWFHYFYCSVEQELIGIYKYYLVNLKDVFFYFQNFIFKKKTSKLLALICEKECFWSHEMSRMNKKTSLNVRKQYELNNSVIKWPSRNKCNKESSRFRRPHTYQVWI